MNKIIKVIVDELPYGCEVCKWMTWDGYCDLLEKALPDVGDERFSECPLVSVFASPELAKEPIWKWLNSLESEDE